MTEPSISDMVELVTPAIVGSAIGRGMPAIWAVSIVRQFFKVEVEALFRDETLESYALVQVDSTSGWRVAISHDAQQALDEFAAASAAGSALLFDLRQEVRLGLECVMQVQARSQPLQ